MRLCKDMASGTILMVTNNYFPYQSGVAQSVNASTQALIACGYNVHIVTLDVAGTAHDADYVIRVPSLVRMRFNNNPIAIPWRTDACLKTIVHTIRPDIIHAHHPWLLGYAALKAARATDRPILFTHHTVYQAYAHYVPLPTAVTSFFITQRTQKYCAQVDHIIAPSQAIADALRLQKNSAPIAVIASPIRPCFFSGEKPASAATKPIKLLYVGRFVPEKNIPAMLDAVARLPQQSYELDCVGYGTLWHDLQRYTYDTRRLTRDRVRFHHKPDLAQLIAWYQQADIFLFPSLTDTQGLVLAEAMACGTPVIALDGPGQRSIIQQGFNGYIVQTSACMAEKILFMTQNRQHLEQLSAGARVTATEYTSERHARQLIALYESVLAKKR